MYIQRFGVYMSIYIYIYEGLGFLYTYVYSTSALTPDNGASEVERDLRILTVKNHRDFRVNGLWPWL